MASVEELLAIQNTMQKQSFAAFLPTAFRILNPNTEFLSNWHLDCIAEHLRAVEDGDLKRLIVNIPPRSLKSITISTAWPAYLMGKNPSTEVICASYSLKPVSLDLSTNTRRIMSSLWYRQLFPDTIIRADQNEKTLFRTTQGGGRYATSVGGTVTGVGGNYLILDDPNQPDKANSQVTRDTANSWVDQTFMSRFNNPNTDKMVVVQQRVHTNDVTGYLQEKYGFYTLKIPAEAPRALQWDINGKTWSMDKGELLHEERMGIEFLNEKKKTPYVYAGQYIQEPAPIGGGEFKQQWIQYYHIDTKPLDTTAMNLYILVDPANSKKRSADSTAMVVIGLAPDNNYYILDMIRDKLNPTQRVTELIKLHKKWNVLSGKPPIVGYEQYGIQTDIHYIKVMQERMNYRFHIHELKGNMSKEDRIRRLIPIISEGRLYFPPNIMYTPIITIEQGDPQCLDLVKQVIEEEMMLFPVSSHDDLLDAMARICDEQLYANFPELQYSASHNIDGLNRGDDSLEDDWMSY